MTLILTNMKLLFDMLLHASLVRLDKLDGESTAVNICGLCGDISAGTKPKILF